MTRKKWQPFTCIDCGRIGQAAHRDRKLCADCHRERKRVRTAARNAFELANGGRCHARGCLRRASSHGSGYYTRCSLHQTRYQLRKDAQRYAAEAAARGHSDDDRYWRERERQLREDSPRSDRLGVYPEWMKAPIETLTPDERMCLEAFWFPAPGAKPYRPQQRRRDETPLRKAAA